MTETWMRGRPVFYWDPRRNKVPVLRRLEVGRRVGNFGDLLGPLIVGRLLGNPSPPQRPAWRSSDLPRMFSVGSVMHFARNGDVVWGTGRNGKIADLAHRFDGLDVRAVRGPLTRDWLRSSKGIDAPAVYGDPALLLPQLAPETRSWHLDKKRGLGVVPNFHDVPRFSAHPGFIEPRRHPWDVIRDILACERIAASSLHGVAVAEAFGIPAVLLPAAAESNFKYLDYARGTGRTGLVEAQDVDRAANLLRGDWVPLEQWDPGPLMAAFPADHFVRT